MTADEVKAARKVIRQLNLVLDKLNNYSEAKTILSESVRVYRKKIETHEKRNIFRRQNQCFELYRKRFYRNLTQQVASEHSVSTAKIKEYWSTIGSEKHENLKAYNEYLGK